MNESLLDLSDDTQIDQTKNYFEELVGEGKKYKDQFELAKAYAHADRHINTLETRFDEIRPEYVKLLEESKTRAKIEDLLTKLDQTSLASRENTHNSNEVTPGIKPEEVESLLEKKLQQHELNRIESDNFRKVQEKALERLGPNYKRILGEQAKALGLSDEDVSNMARRNPNLFAKTFDLDVTQRTENFQTPPRNEQLSSFSPRSGEKRDWKYYQKMREKDPTSWLDKKIAVQMEKDAQELGEAFYA